MKYELLKDLPWNNKGAIIDEDCVVSMSVKDMKKYLMPSKFGEWFKIVEEVKKPKFKIGDYVVYSKNKTNIYIKITHIQLDDDTFIYNWYAEEGLRKATDKEINLYFR